MDFDKKLVWIQPLVSRGDYEALWLDLVKSVPPCDECDRASVLHAHPSIDGDTIYSCGRTVCHEDDGDMSDWHRPWRHTAWAAHVMAARLGGRIP